MTNGAIWWDAGALAALIAVLRERGARVVGPREEHGTLVLDELTAASDLPVGWKDEAAPGRYRLTMAEDPVAARRIFAHRVGAHAWKRFLHPASVTLVRSRRGVDGSLELVSAVQDEAPLALLGVRPCDVAAIATLDGVLLADGREDPVYAARRRPAIIIAVDCVEAGATCFCASMGTGPKAADGYDLALTELVDADRHGFVVRSGSPVGDDLIAAVDGREASAAERRAAEHAVDAAAASMGRALDAPAVRAALRAGLELQHWNLVAQRCLACSNCTQVCPTCFCTTVEDVTDLSGDGAERNRTWDSCFSLSFSYIHGGNVRESGAARYRQWMNHKLNTWVDQFGTYGCVGCGRCIAWCPVGIDLTQEGAVVLEAVKQDRAAARAADGRRQAAAGAVQGGGEA